MKALVIARVNLLRMLRDRSNIFFVFIFPLALILLIGLQFGGGFDPHLAVHVDDHAGALGEDLAANLRSLDAVVIDPYETRAAVLDAVERGRARAGVVVPGDYTDTLRSGGTAEVGYVAREDGTGLELRATVQAAIASQATLVRAARFATEETDLTLDEALARAEVVVAAAPGVDVAVRRVGDATFEEFDDLGQFDLGASQQLTLFVFLTSLAGASALIQTRQWGVATRMQSTPTRTSSVLAGEALGRFAVALTQALYIVVGTLLIFGVDWGSPAGALAIVVLFSAVSAGAAILMGTLFSNDAQAGGMGVLVGLGLAALGGAMAPIEVFPETMQQVARVTPHAWALDAFAELVRRDGGVVDVLPQLGVLGAMAAGLLAVATWRLHAVIIRA